MAIAAGVERVGGGGGRGTPQTRTTRASRHVDHTPSPALWGGPADMHIHVHVVHVHTVEAKITFTYRLRRTVKVRLVSFPFYGQPFFGTLRKRLTFF